MSDRPKQALLSMAPAASIRSPLSLRDASPQLQNLLPDSTSAEQEETEFVEMNDFDEVDESAPWRSEPSEVGRTINHRYRMIRRIGEGGMGVVYEAFDTQVERNVAIKLVRNECRSDSKFMSRFRRELEVTSQLRHPSTIRVFEHGETKDGRPYMVMELLTGQSLVERLEVGKIAEIEALQIARQIAESLSEAHENGIFHRDLKPDNIFIETVGVSTVVKLLDFGIAGGPEANRLTRAGEVFGTPQYMSPEQCNGQPLDHRTDIYSLGCILYEMIEGHPPFNAESPMATMLKHVRNKVPMPRLCTRDTVKLLFLALRKDRTKRVQDCGRFAELLGECIGSARGFPSHGNISTDPKSAANSGILPLGLPSPPVSPRPRPVTAKNLPRLGSHRFIVPGLLLTFLMMVSSLIFFIDSSGRRADSQESSAPLPPLDEKSATQSAESPSQRSSHPSKKWPLNRAWINVDQKGSQVLLDGEVRCSSSPCEIQVPVGDQQRHEILILREGSEPLGALWEPKTVTEAPPDFFTVHQK